MGAKTKNSVTQKCVLFHFGDFFFFFNLTKELKQTQYKPIFINLNSYDFIQFLPATYWKTLSNLFYDLLSPVALLVLYFVVQSVAKLSISLCSD